MNDRMWVVNRLYAGVEQCICTNPAPHDKSHTVINTSAERRVRGILSALWLCSECFWALYFVAFFF